MADFALLQKPSMLRIHPPIEGMNLLHHPSDGGEYDDSDNEEDSYAEQKGSNHTKLSLQRAARGR